MGQTERNAMREVLEEDAEMVIIFEVPGGPDAMENAVQCAYRAMEAIPEELRPPLVKLPGHDEGMLPLHITLNHDKGCPAQRTRTMAACTCESLTAQALPLNEFQIAALEATGEFDASVDYEEGTLRKPSDGGA